MTDKNMKQFQVFKCPACGKPQAEEFDECIYCGVIVAKYLQKKAEEIKKVKNSQKDITNNDRSNTYMNKINDKERVITVDYVLGWIFGILFLFSGFLSFFFTPLSGFFELVIAAILLPPIINRVEDRFRVRRNIKILILIVCLIGLILTLVETNLSTKKSGNRQTIQNQVLKNATPKRSALRKDIVNLMITLEYGKKGNGTIFYGQTNLPDGTKLGMNVIKKGKKSGPQDFDIFVINGNYKSAAFTDHGYPLSGEYEVELFTYFTKSWQKPNIREKLMKYTGPYITKDDFSNEKLEITKRFILDPGVSNNELNRKKANEISSLREYLNKLKALRNEIEIKKRNPKDFDIWSVKWNRNVDNIRKEFDDKFGSNQAEYKGYCDRAYFSISVGYGTLFNLWMDTDSYLKGKKTVLHAQSDLKECIWKAEKVLQECEL